MVKRGDIWLVNLDPTIGSKIKKSRPCVVVSPPELNSQLGTVMVAPMTTKGFAAPFRVPITHAGTKGLIVLDQLRTVDKSRLAKRLGAPSTKTMSLALATLQDFLPTEPRHPDACATACTAAKPLRLI